MYSSIKWLIVSVSNYREEIIFVVIISTNIEYENLLSFCPLKNNSYTF